MVSVIEMDWQDILDGKPFPQSDARRLFCEALETVFGQAQQALPLNERTAKARDLVLAGAVVQNQDGTFTVSSQCDPGKRYTVNGSSCNCPDAQHRDIQCKHLIATWLWRKTRKVLEQQLGEAASTQPTSPIPPQCIVELHGKQFVTFSGLLTLAHERGLVSLKADFITVNAELALAHAVATFADGCTFEEFADATPTNVNGKIRPHFPRMALTRAKGRALRDALNISMVAVEELEN